MPSSGRVRSFGAELNRGALGLPPGPEIEVGAARRLPVGEWPVSILRNLHPFAERAASGACRDRRSRAPSPAESGRAEPAGPFTMRAACSRHRALPRSLGLRSPVVVVLAARAPCRGLFENHHRSSRSNTRRLGREVALARVNAMRTAPAIMLAAPREARVHQRSRAHDHARRDHGDERDGHQELDERESASRAARSQASARRAVLRGCTLSAAARALGGTRDVVGGAFLLVAPGRATVTSSSAQLILNCEPQDHRSSRRCRSPCRSPAAAPWGTDRRRAWRANAPPRCGSRARC